MALALSFLPMGAWAHQKGPGQKRVEVKNDTNYKICNPNDYESCFSDPSTASLPFVLIHEEKTEFAAVLTHGLTDSPYYFKDIAKVLFDLGINVVAPRLAGHGTKPEDLHTVNVSDWRKNVSSAVSLAKEQGSKIILGGFSTGGALSLDYLFEHPEMKIAGLLLFSPATSFYSAKGWAACAAFAAHDYWTDAWVPEKQINPVRYENMSTNGVCQLSKVLRSNLEREDFFKMIPSAMEKSFHLMTSVKAAFATPTFAAYSENDTTISFAADLKLSKKLTNPKNKTMIFKTSKDKNFGVGIGGTVQEVSGDKPLSHSQMPLESNQYIEDNFNFNFPLMREHLVAFIRDLQARPSP